VIANNTIQPITSNARGHQTFRGTRFLIGLVLGFIGLVLVSFGGLAVPVAQALGQTTVDPGLMDTLVRLEPVFVIAGVLHVAAATGVILDRRWGYALAVWMVAMGVFVSLGGIVFATAGRDPFALASPDPAAGTSGLGTLACTLACYVLAALGVGRVINARMRG
jgi:hypothetical protein